MVYMYRFIYTDYIYVYTQFTKQMFYFWNLSYKMEDLCHANLNLRTVAGFPSGVAIEGQKDWHHFGALAP